MDAIAQVLECPCYQRGAATGAVLGATTSEYDVVMARQSYRRPEVWSLEQRSSAVHSISPISDGTREGGLRFRRFIFVITSNETQSTPTCHAARYCPLDSSPYQCRRRDGRDKHDMDGDKKHTQIDDSSRWHMISIDGVAGCQLERCSVRAQSQTTDESNHYLVPYPGTGTQVPVPGGT